MKAYNEKADQILCFLKDNVGSNWEDLNSFLGLYKDDAIITFLRIRGFVFNSNNELRITVEGIEFITTTSFTKQRDTQKILAPKNLTSSENEVIKLLVQGKLYKEIAHERKVSIDTVKKHLKNAYRKLEVDTRKKATLKFLGKENKITL